MKKIFKILMSITGHTMYLTGFILFSIVLLPVGFGCKCIGNYKIPSSLLHYSISFFVRRVLAGLGVLKIEEIKGLERLSTMGPAVYVCNHRGKLDGPLILSIVNYLKPTMKSKYARRPLYWILVKLFDFCEIDVESTNGLVETEKKCSSILQKQSILFFPEGTRRQGDRLSDFKKMAFKIAAVNKVPVVPVIMYNEQQFMTKEFSSFFPTETVRFKLHFLEPVYPEGKTVNELSDYVYRMMNTELQNIVVET